MCRHADSEDSDAQADLSLRWAHLPFRWFYHETAQMIKGLIKLRMQADMRPCRLRVLFINVFYHDVA